MMGRPRTWVSVILVVFVSFATTALSPGSGQARVAAEFAAKVKSEEGYASLRSKAEKKGTVRIIVRVDAPFSARSLPDTEEASRQRIGIRGVQEQLLTVLAGGGKAPFQAYAYKHTPYMAMTVDASTLDAILQSEKAVTVHEDKTHRPALDKSVPLIGADTLQEAGLTGKGYAVAVIDTGVDKNHPFLKGSVVSEACYSSNHQAPGIKVTSMCPGKAAESIDAGSAMPYATMCPGRKCDHGTHVAGIVAGRSDVSSSPGPGVAPEAGIIAVQVFSRVDSIEGCQQMGDRSPCVTAYDSDIKKGLERAIELNATLKIAAVNMSLGGGRSATNCDDDPLKADVDILRAAGTATVVASGNAGYCGALENPACISSVVSVGATDSADDVTDFSCSAGFMTLFAPGAAITSSIPNRKYDPKNGTSMATPHVAGVFALLRQGKPAATVDEMVTALTGTGPNVTDRRKCIFVTKRRVDANEAYKAISTSKFLTVTRVGVGSGTITSVPSGINCGVRCAGLFADAEDVTLTAAASTGQSFTGWSGGGCAGTGECVVTMNDNATVTATFGSSCTYIVSPDHVQVNDRGKEVTVTVSARDQAACGEPSVRSAGISWIAASTASFQKNRGTILLKIRANDNSSPRTGMIYVGDKPIAVTQSETSCRAPVLSPGKGTFSAAAGTGSFTVDMNTDCPWFSYVRQGQDWITITSGGQMSGEGDLSFSLRANTTGKRRTGSIGVFLSGLRGMQTYTITQEP